MNLKNFPLDIQICKFLIGSCKNIRLDYIIVYEFFIVANSVSDIQYGWRLGTESVKFDTKVLLSQFDLIRYPHYEEVIDMNGRMYIS
jgi:hypothetical protein